LGVQKVEASELQLDVARDRPGQRHVRLGVGRRAGAPRGGAGLAGFDRMEQPGPQADFQAKVLKAE